MENAETRKIRIEFHKITIVVMETEDKIAELHKQITQLNEVLKLQKKREEEISTKLAALTANQE